MMASASRGPASDAWARPARRRLCPSILSADFTRLGEEIARIEAAGADFLHVDVMDGRFVPALTFGPLLVEAMRRATRLPLDVHLMVHDPLRFLEDFARAGADFLTVHLEAVEDPIEALRLIRQRGLRAGLSLKPATPVGRILPALAQCDIALLMTVEPGKGGQAFQETAPARIAELRSALDATGLDCLLSVDGGIGPETIASAARAGADTFVAGHSIFRAPDPAGALRALREILDLA